MTTEGTSTSATAGASATAVESLLRTLDDQARWTDRPASRVRLFATAAAPAAGGRPRAADERRA